ncbi:pre-mRNA cleavage complex 2 protein Pcf11 [Pelobates fuscus]|uniref:pre-mRNA cleavage complex 2 protein Pcf11 n=1 Tax=Pelobates fuscus TaxID=191477 RepID=UPI002FE4C8C2
MSEAEAREDACRDYQSSLEDLTFNSKPHINMLTILAEENVQFAKDIVTVIEAQIAKAPTSEKLPVMYLMDSIVKNIGRDYPTAFAKNLVTTFVNVFEKVDENTRKSLYKLRSTWDAIFPSKKLFALDVRVNSIDPAWPIKPVPPNVNTASIHVNPKFLNKSEESPPATIPSPSAVPPRPSNPDVQKQLSQEQVIRQQLLVKQKQLLELQQKKLELELEQTKAQLASSISSVSLPVKTNTATPEIRHPPAKLPLPPPPPVNLEKSRASVSTQPPDRPQVPVRDPRLIRANPHLPHKDQGHKKELKPITLSPADIKQTKPIPIEKNAGKVEKAKFNEKPLKNDPVEAELKGKSKSPSPLKMKSPHTKEKCQTPDNVRSTDLTKKDPRLRKHPRDKTDERDDVTKEKKKCLEKREEHKSIEHRQTGNRNKIVNGVSPKKDINIIDSDKLAAKSGRVSNRKRSHSPKPRSPVRSTKSRSPVRSPKPRSPVHSPKRRERRSPKRRQRSISPIPPLMDLVKLRPPGIDLVKLRPPGMEIVKLRPPGIKPPHGDDFPSNTREERNKRIPKIDARDNRRLKKSSEERQKDPLSPVSSKSSSEPKENIENWQGLKTSKRWKSTWEENKSLQNEEHHPGNRNPYPRHRDNWQNNKGILSPRTQKQQPWLSVDADLKIPKELTSASKGELLKKANERLASGEITQDEFLVVAHQIRQLFQYQEEKRRSSNTWDSPTEESKAGLRKKPLLSNAELTYYEHKARLKRTQVQHPFPGPDLSESEFFDYQLDEMVHSGRESEHGGRISAGISDRSEPFSERQRHLSPIPDSRPYDGDAPIESQRRPDDKRELSTGLREEPISPYNEHFQHNRPRFDGSEQALFSDGDSRITGNDAKHGTLLDDRRQIHDVPLRLPPGTRMDLPAVKGFEESPNAANIRENSPSNACMPFDGPSGNQMGSQHFEQMQVDAPFEPMASKPLDGPRFENTSVQPVNLQSQPVGMQRFDVAQTQIAPVQPMGSQGQPLGRQRFEGVQGPPLNAQRFEGTPGQPLGPQRFEGMQPLGSQRFEGTVGPQRFDGSPRPPLLQQRFDGPQCSPMRFEQPVGQQMRFDANVGQPVGSMRFEGPHGQRFDVNQPSRFDHGPGPQSLIRFDGPPRFDAPVNRFEGQPAHLPRFDVLHGQPCQRFEGPPGHQTPPRFDGPMQMQPLFDGPMPQRFDGPNPQPRFEMPIGHQGPRFENVTHAPIRQNAPPYGQTGPYVDHQNMFQGPPQGMPFQRPEQRFDMPPGPNLTGPPRFPNQNLRPPGPYFDEKSQQGPPFGSFSNMSVGNMPASQPFPPPAPFNQEQPFVPPSQGSSVGVFVNNQAAASLTYPENHLGQLDVNELFSKLLSTGILKASQTETPSQSTSEAPESEPASQPPPEEEDDEPVEDQDVPDLTGFSMEDLKQRYESVITRLYTGIQCYSCGMRFTKSQTDVYADHLDWHYRQNRTEKDRKITYRRWYYSVQDWVAFVEIADLEERAKSQFFEKVHEEVILKTQEAAKEKKFQSIVAGPAGSDEICEICEEQFEQYWDEEEEEWHLKNAMRVNDKIYHPSCYEDYKNTSSFLDSTPSPSKTFLENPLNAMLNLVKEEVKDCSPAVEVKQEPMDTTTVTSCSETIPLLTEIKTEPTEPE